jgi:thiol-disulfide isomerase/thioredoxin
LKKKNFFFFFFFFFFADVRRNGLNIVQRVVDEFQRTATQLAQEDASISFVHVPISAADALGAAYAEEFGATAGLRPCIKVFSDGRQTSDYVGAIKLADLTQFAQRHRVGVRRLASEQAAYDLLWNMKQDALVVGFFQSDSSPAFDTFRRAAEALRGRIDLAVLVSQGPRDKLKKVPAGRDVVAVFRSFDTPAFSEPAQLASSDDAALARWAEEQSTNLIANVDKTTFNVYVQRGLPLVVLWIDPATPGVQLAAQLAALRSAALQFRNRITFLYADGERNRLQAIKFGVPEGATWPQLTLLDMRAFLKYVHPVDQPITRDSVVALCNGFEDKSLAPTLRKQRPFAQPVLDGVTRLVYDTFNDVVFDTSKDVLVAFCRPDVEACDTLTHLLPRVARELAGESNFVVASMDMAENDEPRHSIRSVIYGYPTVKFFPAKDKKALIFEAPTITVDGIVEFMRDKAVNFKPPPLPRPDIKALERKLGGVLGHGGAGAAELPLDAAQEMLAQHVQQIRERKAAAAAAAAAETGEVGGESGTKRVHTEL